MDGSPDCVGVHVAGIGVITSEFYQVGRELLKKEFYNDMSHDPIKDLTE